jgi:hypothetical protein
MDRREMVGGGLVGLTALFGADATATTQRPDVDDAARAIEELRRVFERRFAPFFDELSEIRQQQRMFLKTSHKFPDFIEVGINVWDRLCDWHFIHQQPLTIVRRDDGRYALTFMSTTLVLRPDQADNYVGLAYDAR